MNYIQYIDIDRLHIDHDHQQENAEVEKLAKTWNWCAIRTLIVHKPDDYYVVDGRRRLLAARRRGDIVKLPCIILNNL